MHYTKFVIRIVFLFCFTVVSAQKTEKNFPTNETYQEAITLSQQNSFQSAKYLFEKAGQRAGNNSELKENCDFYYAMCSIKSDDENGEDLMTDFIAKHPSSNKKNNAYLEIGNHFYTHGNPSKSLNWYQKVSSKFMTTKQEEEFNFKVGYAYFSNKKYSEAKQYLSPLTKSKKYSTEASYYIGYIAYLQEDYSTATTNFNKLKDDKKYEKQISYYLLNIHFKQKKYAEVVKEGEEFLKTAQRNEVSEISKIIGESYFYLKNYKAAIPHLKNYRGTKNRLSTNDHYFLGYAYYMENDFTLAIETFNKIIQGNDLVAQNAYYHLASAYVKSDKKSEALNAFKNCSEMEFDQVIKEDALYNYAKLSYDIGNPYKNTAEVLQNYVSQYPSNSKTIEINKLLIHSYINSNDYQGALNYYKKQNLVKDETYQKILMYNGVQLFQNSKYNEALDYFKSASLQLFNKNTQAEAIYWKAESYYRLNNYNESLAEFKSFLNHPNASKVAEYKTVYYDLGYAYFKLKDYANARSYFELYQKNNTKDASKLNDSYVRLGDCHFISKSYWGAITAYNKVIEKFGNDDDYAQYQKALSYGFINRNTQKIETLSNFSKQHPRSGYKDDALYELANAYLNEKENNKAIETYQTLIDSNPRSVYVTRAILKQGLILFNQNKPDESIKKYKSIVEKYPKSKEATQAIANARQVYIDTDKVDEYAAWIRSINYTDVSDNDLDNSMYEAAEKKYVENNLSQAVTSLKKYLINFPEGAHVLKARFYSAQANVALKDAEKSISDYEYVIAQPANEFTEESLSKLAQIYLDKNNWDSAIPVLKKLEVEANSPQNILFAQSNLMKGLYEKQEYQTTVNYAEKVLENKKADNTVKSDAHIYIARSAIKTNNLSKAKTAYKEVSKIAKGILKAEALYYEAYFLNQDNSYEASNKIVQLLAADYASYKYWGVKGLIVMAKNNDGLKDIFQATYILESVIKNYSQFPELTKEAQDILSEIKQREASKN